MDTDTCKWVDAAALPLTIRRRYPNGIYKLESQFRFRQSNAT